MQTEVSKHTFTPGPWEVDKHWIVVSGPMPRANIAMVAGMTYLEEETLEANARLITAAPELLEALQSWVALEPDDLTEPVPSQAWYLAQATTYNKCLTLARAAIAKALGQEAVA